MIYVHYEENLVYLKHESQHHKVWFFLKNLRQPQDTYYVFVHVQVNSFSIMKIFWK